MSAFSVRRSGFLCMRIIGKSFRNSLKPIIYAHTAGASLLLSTFCSFAMLAMRGLTFSSRLFSRRISQQRSYTTEVPPALSPQKMEGPGEDPRPPWVYASTRLVSFVVIPGMYSSFAKEVTHEHQSFQLLVFIPSSSTTLGTTSMCSNP